MKNKKRIFLTGATGTMGHAGLLELSQRLDRFQVTLLARPSQVNKKKLAEFERMEGIRIVWGELMNYDDVLRGVSGADYVLNSIVGMAGLEPTLSAIDAGSEIALANKDTLVAGGPLVMKRAKEKG